MQSELILIIFNYCIVIGVISLVIWLSIKTFKEFLNDAEIVEFTDIYQITQSDIESVIIDKIDRLDDWSFDEDNRQKRKFSINYFSANYDVYLDCQLMAYLNNKDEITLQWIDISNLSVNLNGNEIVEAIGIDIKKMENNIIKTFN